MVPLHPDSAFPMIIATVASLAFAAAAASSGDSVDGIGGKAASCEASALAAGRSALGFLLAKLRQFCWTTLMSRWHVVGSLSV